MKTLRRIIVDALQTPQDIVWSNKSKMIEKRAELIEAAEEIIRNGIEEQTPLVIVAEWRTIGQSPRLDENTFDVFVITDMALLTLFTETVKRDPANTISRPYRSLIWLLKSLFDYSIQESLQFVNVTNQLNFGLQSDKSAAFTNRATELLYGDNFLHRATGVRPDGA
ncbi:HindVP-like restriction endonuclease [Corynebacterium afermentans]